jgi:tRNA(Ile2) C34 agmatinyltransferase TiaS
MIPSFPQCGSRDSYSTDGINFKCNKCSRRFGLQKTLEDFDASTPNRWADSQRRLAVNSI